MRALVIDDFSAPPAVREVLDSACPDDGVVLPSEAGPGPGIHSSR